MKYLLITHNADNLGDVAMAESAINNIHQIDSDATITLESSDSKTSKTYFPDIIIFQRYFSVTGIKVTDRLHSTAFYFANIRLMLYTLVKAIYLLISSSINLYFIRPRLIKEADRADVVLSIAGDSISEKYAFILRFIEIFAISKRTKNLILYAQSIGPFNGRLAKKLAQFSLSRASHIIARDGKTKELLTEYGVTSPIEVTADTVISLNPTNQDTAIKVRKKFQITKHTIAIVVRTKKFNNLSEKEYINYYNNMERFISKLLDGGCSIILTGTIPEDCDTAYNLLESLGLNESDVKVLRLYDYLPSTAKSILSNVGVVVSPRMHPIILASSMGVPVIGLLQEFKLKSYMENIGLGTNLVDIRCLDHHGLVKLTRQTIDNNKHYKHLMAAPLNQMKRLSESNVALLKSYI